MGSRMRLSKTLMGGLTMKAWVSTNTISFIIGYSGGYWLGIAPIMRFGLGHEWGIAWYNSIHDSEHAERSKHPHSLTPSTVAGTQFMTIEQLKMMVNHGWKNLVLFVINIRLGGKAGDWTNLLVGFYVGHETWWTPVDQVSPELLWCCLWSAMAIGAEIRGEITMGDVPFKQHCDDMVF